MRKFDFIIHSWMKRAENWMENVADQISDCWFMIRLADVHLIGYMNRVEWSITNISISHHTTVCYLSNCAASRTRSRQCATHTISIRMDLFMTIIDWVGLGTRPTIISNKASQDDITIGCNVSHTLCVLQPFSVHMRPNRNGQTSVHTEHRLWCVYLAAALSDRFTVSIYGRNTIYDDRRIQYGQSVAVELYENGKIRVQSVLVNVKHKCIASTPFRCPCWWS